MSYFSAVFNTNTQATSLESSRYGGPRKRKRQGSQTSAENEGLATAFGETTPSTLQSQFTLGANTSSGENDTPTEHHQDAEEVHRQPLDSTCFPWELRQELALVNPALAYPTGPHGLSSSDGHRSGLKQQHIAVLTTIMHKSLATGDYMRAGRAWGMLLRAEVKGHPQNIRSNGLWGLGAELLLQRSILSAQRQNPQESNRKEFEVPDYSERMTAFNHNMVKAQFSRQGFEDAKAYYERLILQFPWRKWLPNALSSLHFYPVMFGLWISFTQDQYLSALSRVTHEFEDASDDDSASGYGSSDARSAERHGIRSSAMQSCKAIEDRLDELLQSFPYSDSHALWKVRAMVAQWMSDLSKEEAGIGQENEKEVIQNDSEQTSEQYDESPGLYDRPIVANDEQEGRSEERKRYLEKAKSAFDRAEKLEKHSRSRK
ncbi:hypothetical protein MMC34_006930 [Xylographa carneopallida]|nr:hypothetical protein [Xylographa carneopallida]